MIVGRIVANAVAIYLGYVSITMILDNKQYIAGFVLLLISFAVIHFANIPWRKP